MEPASEVAMQTMEKANKIIEDFSIPKYVLYISLFALETVIAFLIALSI
jgi:hypothetical protein